MLRTCSLVCKRAQVTNKGYMIDKTEQTCMITVALPTVSWAIYNQ